MIPLYLIVGFGCIGILGIMLIVSTLRAINALIKLNDIDRQIAEYAILGDNE